MNDRPAHHHPIVLFDGVCNFCNASVNFIIAREPRGRLRFAALQSEAGRALLREHGLPGDFMTSLVLIEGGRAFTDSTGALAIAAHLRPPWNWLRLLRVVPRFARDAAYRFVGRHRYRWFGRREACRVPTPAERARFL
jgi:predicted DCC family thiol-disulfide oxidoreductase YuxK